MIVLALGLALVLAGGLAARLLTAPHAADRAFRALVIVGGALAAAPAVAALFGAPPAWGPFSAGAATGDGLPFGLDALSAWFLIAVLVVGVAAAVYGVTYLAPERGHRPVGTAHLLVAVIVVALAGVVAARTVVAFLVGWEVMALAAYLLIVFEREKVEARRAGFVYIVLTHACTLALLAMFAAWTGGRTNASFADLARTGIPAASRDLVLLLALLSFGIKAGLLPFHFWLPDAHSSAPTHVSAILSGVMIKTGVYGLLRVLAMTGAPPAWWGWTALGLGAASAVLGVLWALAQHDMKRLLAYHSVENIGIIFMGLGVGALGAAYGHPVIAALGYAGALLHTLNHALFKSLLFLGAGAAGRAGGTREIDRLGGLARRVPGTAAAFLVGSAAIVGLPPLNGFVSEWLVVRGLLGAGVAGDGMRLASLGVVALALTGALALACFSKLYGVAFLGTRRGADEPPPEPEPRGMREPQLALALACVAIGVGPALVLPVLARATATVAHIGRAEAAQLMVGASAISWLAAGLVAVALLAAGARHWALRGRARARVATWGCAYPAPTSRMQYTASSYAAPLVGSFGAASGSRVERTPTSFHTHPGDLVLDRFGRPIWKRMTDAAADLRILQSGGLRAYLLYAVVCLLALLVYLRAMASR